VNAVEFARNILDMQELIEWQEAELDRLHEIEEKYNALLDSSLSHSKKMAGNTLKMLLTSGVAEELIKHNNERPMDISPPSNDQPE